MPSSPISTWLYRALLLTRAIADAVGYLFAAVQTGRLSLPLVHPDTVSATRRIVSMLVWGLGIVVACPTCRVRTATPSRDCRCCLA